MKQHYSDRHSGRHGSCGERGHHHFAGRHGRHGGRHGGFGRRFGRGGDGDDNMMHAGRMLAQGDLRLIVLGLIAEQPRHGYDLIKVIEEKTADWYSPSPGIVYPTLTFLEEVGYVTSQAEGAKKLYSITPEGKAHLEENRALVDAGLQRLAMIGERAKRIRERNRENQDENRPRLPQMVSAALYSLRDSAAQKLESDPEAETKIMEILVRAAGELRKLQQ